MKAQQLQGVAQRVRTLVAKTARPPTSAPSAPIHGLDPTSTFEPPPGLRDTWRGHLRDYLGDARGARVEAALLAAGINAGEGFSLEMEQLCRALCHTAFSAKLESDPDLSWVVDIYRYDPEQTFQFLPAPQQVSLEHLAQELGPERAAAFVRIANAHPGPMAALIHVGAGRNDEDAWQLLKEAPLETLESRLLAVAPPSQHSTMLAGARARGVPLTDVVPRADDVKWLAGALQPTAETPASLAGLTVCFPHEELGRLAQVLQERKAVLSFVTAPGWALHLLHTPAEERWDTLMRELEFLETLPPASEPLDWSSSRMAFRNDDPVLAPDARMESGAFSSVWREGGYVFKSFKPPPEIVRILEDPSTRPAERKRAQREASRLARQQGLRTVDAFRTLRESERFKEAFGSIIPEVELTPGGLLVQRALRGARLNDLASDEASIKAQEQLMAAFRLASECCPGVLIDYRHPNFRFDEKTGALTGWFDPFIIEAESSRYSEPSAFEDDGRGVRELAARLLRSAAVGVMGRASRHQA